MCCIQWAYITKSAVGVDDHPRFCGVNTGWQRTTHVAFVAT